MNTVYDYKKYAILFVDDEETAVDLFTETMSDRFRVLTATNTQDGWDIFQDNCDEIAIVVSDQRMPGGSGTEFLTKIKSSKPRVLRILATAYAEMDAAIEAINNGSIYKYISKPWDVPMMEITLLRGIEFFMLQKERDQLARERFSALHRLMITDRIVSFGLIAAGMQHHLRNSMVAIKTFLSLAPEKLKEEEVDLEQLHNPDFWNNFYQHAESQVKRITDLLTDIEGISSSMEFHYNDHVELHKVVDTVIQQTQNERTTNNLQIENNIPTDLPILTVDNQKFPNIFELLIKDELLYLPQGSFMEFNAEVIEKGDPAKPWIKLTITDNGPPLSENELRSIFDPFFVRSGSPHEFGLYLLACFFLVYHHNGSMHAESNSDGNSFIIELPTDISFPQQRNMSQEFMDQVLLNEALWDKVLSEI